MFKKGYLQNLIIYGDQAVFVLHCLDTGRTYIIELA